MKPPLFVRPLTDDERQQCEAARRTSEACRLRRAHIVLASAQGLSPPPIAPLVGCCVQTVRKVLHAFHTTGLTCVAKHATRPKRVVPICTAPKCEQLPHLLQQSPRPSGKPTGLWTLALAAQVCHKQGVTTRCLSEATIRRAVHRLRANGKRANHWITSPDPYDARKKSGALG